MNRFILLNDNIVGDKRFFCADGTSILIQNNDMLILFDTGRSYELLVHNLSVVGFSVKDIDVVILSHGHDGHIGAVEKLIDNLNDNTIVVFGSGNEYPKRKYYSEDRIVYSSCYKYIEKIKKRGKFLEISNSTKIADNIYAITDVAIRDQGLCGISNKHQVYNGNDYVVDMFSEEISVSLTTNRGQIILCSCAHRGIDNIIYYANSFLSESPVIAVFGGLHLLNDDSKTNLFLTKMLNSGVKFLAPCHCTGHFSISEIRNTLSHDDRLDFVDFRCGSIFEYE